uniref:Uncharacterized protein n=1 Tax=Panagrolaimus superbus TaxID=310955 RepID=A0A914YS02_9BILA
MSYYYGSVQSNQQNQQSTPFYYTQQLYCYDYQHQPQPSQNAYPSPPPQFQDSSQYNYFEQQPRQRNVRRRRGKFHKSAPYVQQPPQHSFEYSQPQSIATPSIPQLSLQASSQQPAPSKVPTITHANDEKMVVKLCISNEVHDRIFQKIPEGDGYFINVDEFMKLCDAIKMKKGISQTSKASSTSP